MPILFFCGTKIFHIEIRIQWILDIFNGFLIVSSQQHIIDIQDHTNKLVTSFVEIQMEIDFST